MASEEDVGITEHVGTATGFSAILKHRFRDFQVHEVDAHGREARLTTLELPAPVATVAKAVRVADGSVLRDKIPELRAAFAAIAGEESAALLATLLTDIAHRLTTTSESDAPPAKRARGDGAGDGAGAGAAAAAAAEPAASGEAAPMDTGVTTVTTKAAAATVSGLLSILLPPYDSKEQRRAVHEFIKSHPGLPLLAADTEETPAQAAAKAAAHAAKLAAGPPAGRGGGRGGRGGGRGAAAAAAPAAAAAAAVTATPAATEAAAAPPAEVAAGQEADKPRICVRFIGDAAGRSAQSNWNSRGGGRFGQSGGRGGGGGRGNERSDWGNDGRNAWAGGAKAHVRFVLWKENIDTQGALANITRTLKLPHSALGFAGTKDKRGATSQFVTGFKVSPARLAGLSRTLRGMRIGNFEFVDSGLRLGQLSGNRFDLVMRSVIAESLDQVAAACETVGSTGFINYFGLQRFGNGRARTDEVGRALLRGEWKTAVRLIMTGRPDEREDCAKARQLYLEKGDAKGALAILPRWLELERCVLGVLAKEGPACFVNAIMALPRTMRTMYLHAYQSYLWNHAASHRVRTYGVDGAIAGDLVLLPRSGADAAEGTDGGASTAADDSAAGGAAAAVGEDTDAELLAAGGDDEAAPGLGVSSSERLACVHVVTEEEAAARKFSIHDVVLPVPGSSVQYPKHATADVYTELLAKDGISMEVPAHSTAELSLKCLRGDYRPVMHKPKNFSYRLVKYAHPDDDSLSTTDLEALVDQRQRAGAAAQLASLPLPPPPPMPAAEEAATAAPDAAAAPLPLPPPPPPPVEAVQAEATAAVVAAAAPGAAAAGSGGLPLTALLLSFQLPPSCYATMLIRELTKESSSFKYQSGLSAAAAATAAGGDAGVPAEAVPGAVLEAAAVAVEGAAPMDVTTEAVAAGEEGVQR